MYCEVETDKATMGWESQEEGFVAQIMLPNGAKDVPLGPPVIVIGEEKVGWVQGMQECAG